jgi:hypothetical protein
MTGPLKPIENLGSGVSRVDTMMSSRPVIGSLDALRAIDTSKRVPVSLAAASPVAPNSSAKASSALLIVVLILFLVDAPLREERWTSGRDPP